MLYFNEHNALCFIELTDSDAFKQENMLEISKENEFPHGNFMIKTSRTTLLELFTVIFQKEISSCFLSWNQNELVLIFR